MIKRVIKKTIIFSIPVSILILLLESVIQSKISFVYFLAYVIGVFTGILNLLLTNAGLNALEFSRVSKPKIYYSLLHVLKLIIYGIVLYCCALYLGVYTSFTCTFGMIFNKILIYYVNLYVIPKEDKYRKVEELDLPKQLIEKLKNNKFNKVEDITMVNRERLLEFLNEKEVELVIESLKKYELFIKEELEAIIDNDNDDV